MDKVNYRAIVIEDVVALERAASDVLKYMLRVHIPNSKTLGHKSSSLSFMSKIHMLFDMGILSSDDVKYFQSLSEIRNQFAHNIDCDSFEQFKSCLLYTSPSPRDQRGSRMPSSA